MTPPPRHFALQMIFFLLPITGAAAETFIRDQNLTALEGSTVTLKCHLLKEDTKVTQVNWNFCNSVHIAFHVTNYDKEGMVTAEFSERVSLAKDYGITISGVNRNDSGQYCCVFNTFPHGKFTGRIYLQVYSQDTWTHNPYLWIGSGLGILLVVAVLGAGIFFYKKKKSQAFYSNINPKTSGAQSVGLNVQNPAVMMATNDIGEEENNEYFNIILYNM